MASAVIYDAFPFLYAGTYTADILKYGFPMGGVARLVDHVIFNALSGNSPIVVFDKGTLEAREDNGYKSNRKPKATILAQAEFAQDILERLGISCIREEFIEADDIICAVAADLEQNDLMFNIKVYSDDLDLAHAVSGVTSLYPASKNGRVVNCNNFTDAVSTSRSSILFNTISAYKFFCGCKSDTIKPLPGGITMYDAYKDWLIEDLGFWSGVNLRDKSYLASYIVEKLAPNLSNATLVEYIERMDLIYPKEYKPQEGLTFWEIMENSRIKDMNLAADITNLTRCRKNAALLGTGFSDVSDQLVSEIRKRADLLKTGTYSASMGVPPEDDMFLDFGRGF